jgi:phosphoribosyl-ATP pyrophosphohydrolase
MLEYMLKELAQVDQWLDDAVSQEYKDQPLAQDWARISKIAEELGEAVGELILLTGQNPRKERTTNDDPLLTELADVVITGMLAMLHFTKDTARVSTVLAAKHRIILARMIDHKAKARKP